MRASHIVAETRSNDTYSFTANANTNLTYVANGLNQGKQADATLYGFDANGNLTSDGWFTFTYDIENKLVSALPINAGLRTLNYDPLNRLDTYNPGTAKRFIYDGAEVVAELDASGNIVARYVRGDAPDEIITGYTSANPTARGWYHLDQRNSVIAVTDPNGVVTVVNRYDEYGQPQGGNYGTFQYTGQMWLGEIGIYNYKNRMYWPNERPGGRFLQADPTGYGPGMNRYAYVNDNPINAVDPSGREGRAFFGVDTDDRSPTRDFTPQGTGWGRHSYDWGGQAAWSALDQRELLEAQAAANRAWWASLGLGQPIDLDVGVLVPLGRNEQAAVNQLMSTPEFTSRSNEAWSRTSRTGTEYAFFVFLNGSLGGTHSFSLSPIYGGGTPMHTGDLFSLHAGLYRTFFASVHTHPYVSPLSWFPSPADVRFGAFHNSISIIRTPPLGAFPNYVIGR